MMMTGLACADALKDEIAPTGKLRVAIAISPAGGAFWSTKNQAGGYAGVPVDLGKEMAAQLGVPVEYVVRPFLQDLEYEVVDLPPEVEARILAFMKTFGLIYGAFDFIVTPEGRYVFLEVNPSGQYMWVECATGLEITMALADALSEPCRYE
jgi:hypothetical protein